MRVQDQQKNKKQNSKLYKLSEFKEISNPFAGVVVLDVIEEQRKHNVVGETCRHDVSLRSFTAYVGV